MGARVSIDHVTHRFDRTAAQPALEDLELQIESGERVVLVGQSGCGKSTLLRMMAGLLRPDRGRIDIDGRRVTHPDASWNLMFQRPALYPWLNARDNVALGLRFTGQTRDLQRRVDALLALVGLAERGRSRVQALSGGQQQRVALARSLALNPALILLDEPFSALDTVTRRTLQNEVVRLVTTRAMTLVWVTHDIDEALMVGDRVVLMSAAPGRFRESLRIDLPYPRNPGDLRFVALRERLVRAFQDGVAVPPATDGVFPRVAASTLGLACD